MSELRVNAIVNAAATGAPEFTKGVEFPNSSMQLDGNVNVTGVATATSFSGDGSGLTFSGAATNGEVLAYTLVQS